MFERLRHLENIHIPMWLIKDSCWMMHWKIAGTVMVLPTIAFAAWIAWVARRNTDLLLPNLAVLAWIIANAFWMMGEFYDIPFQTPSITFFCLGILLIGWFFARYFYARFRNV